jgi:hypothetical protein
LIYNPVAFKKKAKMNYILDKTTKLLFMLIVPPSGVRGLYPLSDNLKISPNTPLAVTAEPAPAP